MTTASSAQRRWLVVAMVSACIVSVAVSGWVSSFLSSKSLPSSQPTLCGRPYMVSEDETIQHMASLLQSLNHSVLALRDQLNLTDTKVERLETIILAKSESHDSTCNSDDAGENTSVVCADCQSFERVSIEERRIPIRIATTSGQFWVAELYSLRPVPQCALACYIDVMPKDIKTAVDGLIHVQDPHATRHHLAPVNIYFTMEVNTPENIYGYTNPYADEDFSQRFDITMDYHLQDDEIIQQARRTGHKWIHIPALYSNEYREEVYRPPWHTFEEKVRSTALATAFISNCGSPRRTQVLDELLASDLEIYSYGTCRNNRKEADDAHALGCDTPGDTISRYGTKLCIISKSLFYFAFDNSFAESYVSEKLYHAFASGTVPVYIGAPNVEKFDPMYGRDGPRSIIKASDFNSTGELVAHLQYLASNRTAYEQYLVWKTLPPTERMKQMIDHSYFSTRQACRLCQAVAFRLQQINSTSGR